MNKDLRRFEPVAQAISILFHPYAEVVIHNLETGLIEAIYNNLSKRKAGDESLIQDLEDDVKLPDVFSLYFKTNWDGRRMKSVTATIRDARRVPIGLLCINIDLSKWEDVHRFVQQFIQGSDQNPVPEVLFKDDWREKINLFVTDFLKREGTTLKALTKEKKRELIGALHREGAFEAKNAATYIADVLGLSRATIYNYLR